MVQDGQAHCYMLSGPEKQRYQDAEKDARKKRRGLWNASKIQEPRLHRASQKERQKTVSRMKIVLILALAGAAAAALFLNLDKLPG